MQGIKLLGYGKCLPSKIVTNEDMEHLVETSDEWITKRTGIKTRHHCTSETHLDLAVGAARQAIATSGVDVSKIGTVVVATITGEYLTPSTASMVQATLGLEEDTACFDVGSACTGFVYSLRVAYGMVTEEKPYALVIGCEVLSRVTDFTDRGTCILFGDGAGAVVMERGDCPMGVVLGSRGNATVLNLPTSYSEDPSYISMEGTEVFKFAVDMVPKTITKILERANLTVDDIDHIVMHQANARILDNVIKKLKLPQEKVIKIIDKYANMSAACIPIALSELEGKPGDKVLMVGFGGGLTWGGMIVEL